MPTNNNLAVRSFQKEFKEALPVIFAHESYFQDYLVGGTVEALDGVAHNKTAFSVKTSDIPVAIGQYSTDANTAFGTGTGNTTRFGERKEVIYTDTDVPYTWNWAWHEGIDRATVNNDFENTIADRLELQAVAKAEMFDMNLAKHIVSNATDPKQTIAVASTGDDDVTKALVSAGTYLTNLKARGRRVLKANPALYNAIVDHKLATTAKNSTVNIDNNMVVKFKGFEVYEVPESAFPAGTAAVAYIAGIGKQFTGINTSRTIESEDFDGVAFQGEGKAGEYTPDDNKKAVIKFTLAGA